MIKEKWNVYFDLKAAITEKLELGCRVRGPRPVCHCVPTLTLVTTEVLP
jgi:hypothetical protein